jgi:predicted lipoprotein with Yx(FWY)xxD motif
MKKRLVLTMAGLAISALALAGCSSTASAGSSPSGSSPSGSSSSGSSKSAPAATGDDLATGKTSLGNVVVDGKGDTVYLFTKDTANSGKSTCTGACATVWPAVTTTSATPTVTGVTGKVGTITLADGTMQVTLDGWPLYTFASDSAAGDVGGQGVMGIWWVVSPAGDKITKAAAATPSGTSSGSSAGGGWS